MSEAGGVGRGPLPGQVVGVAIQNLAAARLARGFVPFAILFVGGVASMLTGRGGDRGLVLALGAPVAAGALLAHGLKIVQGVLGRPRRPWMAVATLTSVLPPLLAVWVVGWWGLRAVAAWQGLGSVAAGVAWTGLGGWSLRAWLRLVELDRLARAMDPGTLDAGEHGP